MCTIKSQTYSNFSSRNSYGYSDPTAAICDKIAKEQWDALIAASKAKAKAKKPVYRLAWKPQA